MTKMPFGMAIIVRPVPLTGKLNKDDVCRSTIRPERLVLGVGRGSFSVDNSAGAAQFIQGVRK